MKNMAFTLPKNNTNFETYKKENLSDKVCETRSNPVSIRWNILDNSVLANTGLAPESMENWSDMFQIVDGELKEHYYIADLIRVLFKKSPTRTQFSFFSIYFSFIVIFTLSFAIVVIVYLS